MNDEVKKRRGRPPKPRQGILSAEQILAIRGDAPQTVETVEEAAERREAERQRGIARRAQAKAEKQMGGIETLEDLLKLNRATLTEQQREDFHQKQERVFDLDLWMKDIINGTNLPPDDEDYVSLESGRPAVEEHVQANGLTLIEVSLIEDFWKSAELYARFQQRAHTDATSTFAVYGYVVGIPAHRYQQWQEFLRSTTTPTATVPATGNGYTYLCCSIPDCNTPPEAVHIETAARYTELGIKYFCHRCHSLEAKSRAESTIVQRGAFTVYGESK